MSKALYARGRGPAEPEWGWRLIDNEEWAIKAPRRSPVGELTTRRAPQLEEEAVSR